SFGEDRSGRNHLFTGVVRDITAQVAAEKRIEHLAYHDALTELPNRALFHDRLSQSIVRARRQHQRVAVLFLDLDDFKRVNDSLGHARGDAAMYRAKQKGPNVFEFFDGRTNPWLVSRSEIEHGLYRALERDELMLHYQPIWRTRDERVTGVEALLRWNHPLRGHLLPAEF